MFYILLDFEVVYCRVADYSKGIALWDQEMLLLGYVVIRVSQINYKHSEWNVLWNKFKHMRGNKNLGCTEKRDVDNLYPSVSYNIIYIWYSPYSGVGPCHYSELFVSCALNMLIFQSALYNTHIFASRFCIRNYGVIVILSLCCFYNPCKLSVFIETFFLVFL